MAEMLMSRGLSNKNCLPEVLSSHKAIETSMAISKVACIIEPSTLPEIREEKFDLKGILKQGFCSKQPHTLATDN